jgi:Flp pilus assembly protein TadG
MLNLYRFGTDRSGSVAVLFSVVLVPALMLVGAATDYARVVASRARLQSTVDAAVLAAGLDVSGASDATLQGKAQTAVEAAFPAGSPVRVASVSLRTVNNTILVTVNAETSTNFGGFFGLPRVATTTTAAVPKQSGR